MTNDKFILDVVQAAELKYAFERNGWTNAEIKTLAGGDMLAKVRDVVRGFSEIKPILHAIDCDSPVFIPDGWSVLPDAGQLPDRVNGIFTWDPTSAKLYLSKKQNGDKYILGNDLCKELKSQPVFTANVLDYLLAHPELIPEDWKGKAVFFWGTIYRDSGGSPCVRFLYWGGGGWGWVCCWLDCDFDSSGPALVRAS